jgi:hypothetical protein
VIEPIQPDRMRVSDMDRKLVEQGLRLAHEDGSLDLSELDDRLVALWQARTRGELATLVADLPAPMPPPPPPPVQSDAAHQAMRVLTAIWLSLSAVNLIIWLIVLVTEGMAYPWFIWVVLPPGAVLGVLRGLGVGRRRGA